MFVQINYDIVKYFIISIYNIYKPKKITPLSVVVVIIWFNDLDKVISRF